MPSYFKVFPQNSGTFRGSRGDPADHIFDISVQSGVEMVRMHIEVLFRAVNDLDIEEFFRGFEFTGLWLPEADTNGDLAQILSLGSNRAGRYPEPDDRPSHSTVTPYSGIWGDANAPMIGKAFHDRFYLRQTPDKRPAPDTDKLFIQPGGFSANAENMFNLKKIRPDYYQHMDSQLDDYDSNRLVNNRPGYGRHGQPVHPNFDQETHVAKRSIEIDKFSDVYIGVDAGSNALVPGAAFMQRSYSGQWRVLAEIYLAEGQMNTDELAREIRRIMESRFGALGRDQGAMLCLDPAAGGRNAASEYTTALSLQQLTGIEAQLAPSNDPKHRRSALDKLFKRMIGPKEPGIVIDPACVGLLGGLAGGFHYAKRSQVVSPSPAKNRFSHVCEAAEYAPLTVDGLDATEGRFIRPGGAGSYDAPTGIYD
jgi:hypothetical protein